MIYKRLCKLFLAFMFFICPIGVFAENIDPNDDGSQYAYGQNVGWLNLEPGGDGGPGVEVGDYQLTGYAWGENIGWISLSCENTNSCAIIDYGIVNDGNGNLSGYAWGENVGWINFAPTGGGVFVDACGDFNGIAWGENIGWISFRSDGDNPFYIRTSWVSPIDEIAPVTEPDSPILEWYTDDIDITLSATDCGSGVMEVHYILDGGDEVIISGTSASVSITEECEHTLSYFSVDHDGNIESYNEVTIRVDKNPPAITVASPANGAIYNINEVLLAGYSVTDTCSGVASTTAPVNSGEPFDTSTAGSHTFAVSATDFAGHTNSVTHTYTIAFPGNIDPVNEGSHYAWGENVGWINLKPSYGPGVTVTRTGLTGYAWGENIGWINLNPVHGGVTNDGYGNLSGYAWGENVGWINFAPMGAGVTIDPVTGEFSGYAWGENIGWINFAPTGAGINTSWRGWAQTKLIASDGAQYDYFGVSVAINGNTAVVGAQAGDGAVPDSGSAYVFRYDGTDWIEEAELTASDGEWNDLFGISAAISGNTVLVGAGVGDGAVPHSGSAYVFRYDGTDWVEESKLTASDGAQYDAFGVSVAINGNTILIGAIRDDDAALDSGSAYVYELTADTPVGNYVVVQPIDNMTGTSPVTLTFSEVTQGGTTSLTTSNTGPSPPSGFILGFPPIYYELTTTATFSGPIQVCINYSGINFTGDEQNLRLYHYEYGVPVDVTVSVNAATNTICGTVTFLSPFAILQPKLDVDADGIDDFREAEFGPGGIIILNPTSSPPDTASLIGTASDGSTIITGDLTVDFPAGTTTSAAITIDYNDDEAPPGVGPSVTISGASLPASSTKSITMPFIDSEGYPMNSVCIDDTPNASVHGMTGGSCGVQNVHINIPIIDGGLNTSGPYSVYRSGTFITVAGLSHTAIAALQVRAQEGRRDVIQLCMCLAEEVPWQFDQWFGTVTACIRRLNSDPDVWCDFSCLTCAWYPFPCEPCREYMSPCKCQWPGPEGQ